MAELERIANHLGDIGAICNDAAFALMHAHCGVLRERVLRAAAACFGHRLMMDQARPGGVMADLPPGGSEIIRQLVAEIRRRWAELVTSTTTQPRCRTAPSAPASFVRNSRRCLVAAVLSAAPRAAPSMRGGQPGYPPYEELSFEIPVRHQGDVDARVWVRIGEVEQSLALIEQLLDGLPAGPVRSGTPARRTLRRSAKGWRWSRAFVAISSSGCGCAPTERSLAAISATRRGSSGRCWKQ